MKLLPFSAFLLVLAGCGASIQRPTAAVRGMSLGEATPQGFTMNFDVEVENPNRVALPTGDVEYKLRLVERDFLEGKADPEDRIPANGSASMAVPVWVSFEDLLGVADGIRASRGDVPYDLEATLEFGGGMPLLSQPVRVPVRHSGVVPLRKLLSDPGTLLRSSAAQKLAERILLGR